MSQDYIQAIKDINRLEPIFQQPESRVALERFNELIHRPSESMISSLVELLAHNLNLLCSHGNRPPQNVHLHQDPVFTLILINKFIQTLNKKNFHLNKIKTTYERLFYKILITLNHQRSHLFSLSSIHNQILFCLKNLIVRVLVHFNLSLKVFNPIHDIFSFLKTDLHDDHSVYYSLHLIEDVFSEFDQINSIDSNYICQKITRNHFEDLVEIYLSLAQRIKTNLDDEREYKRRTKLTDVVLKILKSMIKHVIEVNYTNANLLARLNPNESREIGGNATIANFTNLMLRDFQYFLEFELSRQGMISGYISSYNRIIEQLQIFALDSTGSNKTSAIFETHHKIVTYISHQIEHDEPHRIAHLYPILRHSVKILANLSDHAGHHHDIYPLAHALNSILVFNLRVDLKQKFIHLKHIQLQQDQESISEFNDSDDDDDDDDEDDEDMEIDNHIDMASNDDDKGEDTQEQILMNQNEDSNSNLIQKVNQPINNEIQNLIQILNSYLI